MAIAVADLDGTIIGLYRMADSTVFSVDVAATKARNMVYFSGGARTAADLDGRADGDGRHESHDWFRRAAFISAGN